MKTLWTFESREKAEPFIMSLRNAGIEFEAQSKGNQNAKDAETTILVAEDEYVKAKRLLMRHRKRRTSS